MSSSKHAEPIPQEKPWWIDYYCHGFTKDWDVFREVTTHLAENPSGGTLTMHPEKKDRMGMPDQHGDILVLCDKMCPDDCAWFFSNDGKRVVRLEFVKDHQS
jgi:hypothetical protein